MTDQRIPIDLRARHNGAARGEVVEAGAPLKQLPGVFTDTSYTLPPGLPIDTWVQIGGALQQVEQSIRWWLGDWWRYGERAYGEMATQAAKDHVKDVTGYAYNTVRRAADVANAFPEPARRRADIPFSHHQDVAALPKREADKILTRVKAEGLSSAVTREIVKEKQVELAMLARAALPAPAVRTESGIFLTVGDACALPLPDACVQLICTSPPYALEKPYGVERADIAPAQWRLFMVTWLTEACRVASPGARLALNVPLDTTSGGYRPTYAQAIAAAQRAGWTYRTTIVWHDDQLGKSTARGSVDTRLRTGTAAAPHVIAPVEMIGLFSKGPWGRALPDGYRPELDREDWLAWTNGAWSFPGVSLPWEGHPAPFPEELPRRLITLLSFPDDLILDPFIGSGTTAVVARRLGRRCIGVDKDPGYIRSTRRRLARGG